MKNFLTNNLAELTAISNITTHQEFNIDGITIMLFASSVSKIEITLKEGGLKIMKASITIDADKVSVCDCDSEYEYVLDGSKVSVSDWTREDVDYVDFESLLVDVLGALIPRVDLDLTYTDDKASKKTKKKELFDSIKNKLKA